MRTCFKLTVTHRLHFERVLVLAESSKILRISFAEQAFSNGSPAVGLLDVLSGWKVGGSFQWDM